MSLQDCAGSDERFSSYVEGLAQVIGHADRVKAPPVQTKRHHSIRTQYICWAENRLVTPRRQGARKCDTTCYG